MIVPPDDVRITPVRVSGASADCRPTLANGGLSVSLGTRSQAEQQTRSETTATGSLIGALHGDLTLTAGNDLHITGSTLYAGHDINLTGQTVTLDAAYDTVKQTEQQQQRQAGLTLGLTSPVITAVQTARQMAQSAQHLNGDARLTALAAATAGLAAKNAYDAVGGDLSSPKNLSLNLSLGESHSQSQAQTQTYTAQGSTVTAGNNVTITAVGGPASHIDVIGSTLKAGQDIRLAAEGQINLQAAQNTRDSHSSNDGSSAQVGIALSVGTQTGLAFTAGAANQQGHTDETATTWTNTHLTANRTLTLQSGGDTTLQGAVASAKQVIADIGGDLKLTSLQDTDHSDGKQQSAGVNVSVCVPPLCVGPSSLSAHIDQTKLNGDLASVGEQTGIKAGEDGYQIKVNGKTDLTGSVIASAADPSKNNLTTATLTTSDIQNHAEAQADSSGIALSSDNVTQGNYGIAKGVIGNLLNNGDDSGHASGTTKSAISEGNITITDEAKQKELTGKTSDETVASINRDTENANTVVTKQDVEGMKQAAEAAQQIKQGAFQQATRITDAVYEANNGAKKILLVQPCATGGADCKQATPVDLNNHTFVQGPDGQVYVFNNGIMNTEQQAIDNAVKQQGEPAFNQGIYVIVNPHTGNALSEVVYAGLDKLREITKWTNLLGISNTAQANTDLRNVIGQYNQQALANGGTPLKIIEVDHSRGSLTSSIATQNQIQAGQTNVPLNTVIFNGAAANAERMANAVKQATGGQGQVYEATHKDDPVGAVIGGNTPTGGVDTTFLKAHTSYTNELPPQLNPDGKINPLRSSTDDVWGVEQINKPVLVPPASKDGRK